MDSNFPNGYKWTERQKYSDGAYSKASTWTVRRNPVFGIQKQFLSQNET